MRRGISTYDDDELDDSRRKIALVLGSSGCLGNAVVQHLRKNLGMKVLGADVVAPRDEDSTTTKSIDAFIHLPKGSHATAVADISTALVEGLSDALESEEEIDAIICACGGWMGDPSAPKPDLTEDEFLTAVQEYSETVHKMLEMNLYPVLAAGYAANRFMANEGLFVAIGATPALSPTPGMLAYGLSKVGVHHFVQTLGETTGKAVTTRSRRQKARRLRKNSEYLDTLSVIGILPTTLDTPNNRKQMPDADFDDWTKPKDIAKEIGVWIDTPEIRPHSGSLLKVHPSKGNAGGATFILAR